VTNEEAVLVNLYSQANPSVVSVLVYYSNPEVVGADSSQGSGFVYDSEGDIITNAHVVQGADRVEVVFSNSHTYEAKIVGKDLYSDLAVIKVDSLPEGVVPLALANMDDVAVGQTVVAIGNPFGLGGTMTRGIISAMGRAIPALADSFSIPEAIQTDAPINPGNSGGPLLNLQGEVVGVNAQIQTSDGSRSNSGVGFAIPVSIINRVVPDLVKDGKHSWAWLGVRGGSVTPTLVKAMKLPIDSGAYVSEIISGGAADKAGLKGSDDQVKTDTTSIEVGGDVITAIDGQPVTVFEDILVYIALHTSPGQKVTLTVLRNGKYQDFTLILQERPSENN
jgi:serine protease Do